MNGKSKIDWSRLVGQQRKDDKGAVYTAVECCQDADGDACVLAKNDRGHGFDFGLDHWLEMECVRPASNEKVERPCD